MSGTELATDDEAAALWLKIGAPKDRIIAVPGLKENFWAMGDTGPCGPCSEIFYDMGPAASDQGHADCKFPCDCGRYVEIWNLVFMQFNRDAERRRSIPCPSLPLIPAWASNASPPSCKAKSAISTPIYFSR